MKTNIEKYLNRIKLSGPMKPDLEHLRRIQKQHLLNIPFENFDIHSDVKIELDTDKIYDKIINNNRGGFCYELNGLLFELLSQLGYKVRRISARVFHKQKYGREHDHLAIIATIGRKEYLVDVGFGEFCFHPLAFELGKKQIDERGIYVFDQYDQDYFRVSKIVNGEQIPEYIFKDIARDFDEFNEMSIHHQTSSESHFTQKKFITIPTENGRVTITNQQLKIKEGEEITEREIGENEMRDLLARYFNFEDV